MSAKIKIPFGDLRRQYLQNKIEFDKCFQTVLDSGWFVLGKQLELFEEEFARYCGAGYAVGVGSGTEALHLALVALGVGRGDEVITVANTCVPTVSAISLSNATPVLTDVIEASFTMNAEDLKRRITRRTKVIIPVHLYGQSAHLDEIRRVAESNGIHIVEDAAQAHGTEYKGKKIGSSESLTCFSFYPSKNLGCFGDGGCITTNDGQIASKLKMLRNYGQRERYYHCMKGFNSRLDEIQAALLSVKLRHLDDWNNRRRSIARMYANNITNPLVIHPQEMGYGRHIYHLYVIRVKRRNAFQTFLHEQGIATMIHYPVPIHLQESYQDLGYKRGDFPISEALAKEIVSLPMYPELTDEEILYICDVINHFD